MNIEVPSQLQVQFDSMKAAYDAAPFPDYATRKALLTNLKSAILEYEESIYEALNKDYGYRSEFDSLIADVLPTIGAIKYAIKNLKKWMRPSKRNAGIMLAPSKVYVHYQPVGVVGIIAPWNFPFFLALGPAVQALAAGNRILIKMSEFTPHSNQVLRAIFSDMADHVEIIEGEADIGAEFASLPFDHLIFTGSTDVGRLVANSAANNLTPITLELGGKSPTVIDEDINMNIAVDAIILGKSVNTGQMCVAPDYVFVPENREKEFIATFLDRYADYYVNDKNQNKQTHVILDRLFERQTNLLEDAKTKGASIQATQSSADGRFFSPCLVTNVNDDMDIMNEEIFGSILPIKTYQSIEEVISYINLHPRPLALYIMSKNNTLINTLLNRTHSGGVAINDTAMHAAADDAPFGGIGSSGMGHYHGFEGFQTFSKAKTVLHSKAWLPKNHILLKHRDIIFNVLRGVFIR